METQKERVISPSACCSKSPPGPPPSPHSSWLTCSSFMCFTAAKSYICISSAMGGELCFLRSSLLQFTSPWDCLDQLDLFSFDLALIALVDLFPDQRPVYTKTLPVFVWFCWLLAKLTSGRILLYFGSLSQSLMLTLRHASPAVSSALCALLTSPNPSSRPTLAFFIVCRWISRTWSSHQYLCLKQTP